MPTVIIPDTMGFVGRLSAAAGSAFDRGPQTRLGNSQTAVSCGGSVDAVTYVSVLLDMDSRDDGQVHSAAPLVLCHCSRQRTY